MLLGTRRIMSVADALIRRKADHLAKVQEEQRRMLSPQLLHFTQAIPTMAEISAEGSSAVQMPDNWLPPIAGSYFASREELPDIHGMSRPLESERYHVGESPSPGRSARLSPAEFQRRLDQLVTDRVTNALEEQRASEAARLEACKAQRHIEIMKFHQKMKQRTELQLKSGQFAIGHSIGQMDLGNLLNNTCTSTGTRAAAERAVHRGDAQAQFIDYNRDRIEHNLLHRQYMQDIHQERQRFRQGLEAHIGTDFSKSKTQLLNAMGVTGPSATFTGTRTIPALKEQHDQYVASVAQRKQEDDDVRAMYSELCQLDESLWEARRMTKGQKNIRAREIEYSATAVRKTPSSTPN